MRNSAFALSKPGWLMAIVAASLGTGASGCSSGRAFVPSSSSAVLPQDGIVLEEGENISGVYEWHESIPMFIDYTYSFRRPTGQVPGLLEMEFELVNGEVYSVLTVNLIVADENRRIISEARLFERKARAYVTGPRTKVTLNPDSAHSFAFAGSGFFNRNRPDDLPGGRVRPFGF